MTPKRLAEIRRWFSTARVFSVADALVGFKHRGGLLAEVDRLRATLDRVREYADTCVFDEVGKWAGQADVEDVAASLREILDQQAKAEEASA